MKAAVLQCCRNTVGLKFLLTCEPLRGASDRHIKSLESESNLCRQTRDARTRRYRHKDQHIINLPRNREPLPRREGTVGSVVDPDLQSDPE